MCSGPCLSWATPFSRVEAGTWPRTAMLANVVLLHCYPINELIANLFSSTPLQVALLLRDSGLCYTAKPLRVGALTPQSDLGALCPSINILIDGSTKVLPPLSLKAHKRNREEWFPEDQEIWRLCKKHQGKWGSWYRWLCGQRKDNSNISFYPVTIVEKVWPLRCCLGKNLKNRYKSDKAQWGTLLCAEVGQGPLWPKIKQATLPGFVCIREMPAAFPHHPLSYECQKIEEQHRRDMFDSIMTVR